MGFCNLIFKQALSNKKCFLAEIKTASSKTRSERRRQAREQLAATIELLKANGIEPEKYNTTAVICFKSNRPVIVNAASSTARANFLSSYGIPLQETNIIHF